MSKKIIILTGSELRHDFMRLVISSYPEINVIRAYCEGAEKSLHNQIREKSNALSASDFAFMEEHANKRVLSEEHYFREIVENKSSDGALSYVIKGGINEEAIQKEIIQSDADYIICYGCSILKGGVLKHYEGRIINLHLGLSPYYRGSGTNFFALVNGEPECVGGTFMILDAGIDTGAVLHQVRARVEIGDTPHDVGNRLIYDCAYVYPQIILNFDRIAGRTIDLNEGKLYQRKDLTPSATRELYKKFEHGLVTDYLEQQDERQDKFPIIVSKLVS